jgi:hypothetical protein
LDEWQKMTQEEKRNVKIKGHGLIKIARIFGVG